MWTLLSIIFRGDFGVGGEWAQFCLLYSYLADKTETWSFFMGICITPVCSANIHGTPALSKASCTKCQQWGILTTIQGKLVYT